MSCPDETHSQGQQEKCHKNFVRRSSMIDMGIVVPCFKSAMTWKSVPQRPICFRPHQSVVSLGSGGSFKKWGQLEGK
jgi:hypothetical protein